MAGVKERTVGSRTSAEGNVCPCLAVDVLEVHAAVSVTIHSQSRHEGTLGAEQRPEGHNPLCRM